MICFKTYSCLCNPIATKTKLLVTFPGKVKNGEDMYFYMVIQGRCVVIKDGQRLCGVYGTLGEGTSFGEEAILFVQRVRSASVLASGKVVLYRLNGAIFRDKMDKDELAELQIRMRKVIKVFDTLSGKGYHTCFTFFLTIPLISVNNH